MNPGEGSGETGDPSSGGSVTEPVVDGFSLALDFPLRRSNYPELMRLMADFDRLQREAGGGVYAAKDAVSRIGRLGGIRGDDRGVMSSNLVRRWRRS